MRFKFYKTGVAVCLAATLLAASLSASAEEMQTRSDTIGEFESERNFFLDTWSVLTEPVRWDKSDLIRASIVSGVTLGLYIVDDNIQDWVQDNRNSTSDDISNIVTELGDGKNVLPPLGLFYLYGHLVKDEKARRTSIECAESFLASGILVQLLKVSFHRKRPNKTDSKDDWDGPGLYLSDLSFPSGHSSTAFSIATVIATEYKNKPLVPPLAYGVAALTALSRINDDKHWASDVFMGSAIGYFSARAVLNLHDDENDRGLSFVPAIGHDNVALYLFYEF
jgi:PAP2 superfamily